MPGVAFHSVPHFGRGRGSAVNGVVIHQFAGGTVPAVQNWLRDPRSRVSYHFGVGRNGEIRQWVDTADTAWATGPVNARTIAIGHESTNQPFTVPAQIEATARIIRWARGAHGSLGNGRATLTGHRQHMQTTCPGNPIFGQLDELQRRALGAAPPPPPPPAPGGVPPFPGRILINRPSPNMMNGQDVRDWQQRARLRWQITVDGWYGSQSEAVCRDVQRAAGLPVDGRVGPNTWPATWRVTAGGTAPPPPPIEEVPEVWILRVDRGSGRVMTYSYNGEFVRHIPDALTQNNLAAARPQIPIITVTMAALRSFNGGRDPDPIP
jgi:peptidoglycan hydrolase-like protein with peptidoglycan-binding domain